MSPPSLSLTSGFTASAARKMALAWGVHPVHTADAQDLDEMVAKARQIARAEGFAGPGENIWSNVHIDDLVPLYLLAVDKAPAGSFSQSS